MKTIITLSGIGTAILTFSKINLIFNKKPPQEDPEIEVPIQELIKEAFLRISTK